jgi:hypothetical protein
MTKMGFVTLVLLVFLIFCIPASDAALQKSITFSSQGTISYDTTPPTDPNSTARGELYMWIGFWLSPSESRTQRIVNARDTYGIPIWLDAGNWGTAHLTSSLINYLHEHGVKVVARVHSMYGETSLDTLLHSMDPTDYNGGVDYQMSIGPEIDAFMIDEVNQNNIAYYQTVVD